MSEKNEYERNTGKNNFIIDVINKFKTINKIKKM